MEKSPTEFTDFDLRERLKLLFRYKWIILILMILAAVAAWAASEYVLPKQYRASAVVKVTNLEQPQEEVLIISRPWMRIQFMPRMPDGPGLEQMARSDVILGQVAQLAPEFLQSAFRANYRGNEAVELDVTHSDPEKAAELTNLWAQTLATHLETEYNIYQSLVQLEEHVEAAYQDLENAETALSDILVDSQLRVLEIRMDVVESNLNHSLSIVQRNNSLIEDALRLDAQLSGMPGDDALTVSQGVTLLSLFQRTASIAGDQQGMIALNNLFPEGYSVSQAIDELGEFIASLQIQTDEYEVQIVDLETQITSLSDKIAGIEGEIVLYTRQRDLAIDDVVIMQAQMIEANNLVEQDRQVAEVLSSAEVPEDPISPNILMNVTLAPAIVLMLAVFLIYLIEWWLIPVSEESKN